MNHPECFKNLKNKQFFQNLYKLSYSKKLLIITKH